MGHFFESQSGKLDWILAITWVSFDKFWDLIWLEGLDYDQQLIQESRPVCCDLLSFEIKWFDLESVQESRPVQWLGQPPPSHIHSCSWPSASNTARNPLWSSCKPFQNIKTLDTAGEWETFLSRKLSLPSTPPARCVSNLGCMRSFGLLLWFELMNYYYYY